MLKPSALMKFLCSMVTSLLLVAAVTNAYAQPVAPDAPTIGSATAGAASATVSFTPPAFNGGSAITGYTVTANPGPVTAAGPSSPITLPGLTPSTLYTFTVTATNAVGAGPASTVSNSVTPAVAGAFVATVTNTADSGAGSLRQALLDVNANCAAPARAVNFNISGAGPHSIVLTSTGLPGITCANTTIDGYSQTGASANTGPISNNSANLQIIVNGNLNTKSCFVIGLGAFNVTIKGLAIHSCSFEAIYVNGNNALILGNYIGTDPGGMNAFANGGAGIKIDGSASGAQIGDGTLAGINLITAHAGANVLLFNSSASTVNTNMIGGDRSGGSVIASSGHGIECSGGCGLSFITGNRIFRQGGSGVLIGTTNNGVQISQNSIFATVAKGVDTNTSGNSGIQKPVITGVSYDTSGTGSTSISGNYVALDNTLHKLEFFENPTTPTVPSGQLFYNVIAQNPTAAGPFPFSDIQSGFRKDISVTLRRNSTGDTSEFSNVYFTPLASSPALMGFVTPATVAISQTLTFTNITPSSVSFLSAAISGSGFTKTADTCSATTLAVSATCNVTITFMLATATTSSGSATFVASAGGVNTTFNNPLSGTTTAAPITATYAPATGLDFGMRTVGVVSPSMQGTFTNTSGTTLSLISVSFNGGGAGFNVLGSSQCLTAGSLAPGASCTFDIMSTPNAVGPLNDSVYVGTSPANVAMPTALPLAVTGVAPPPITASVANTNDSGPGSLRQAITDANAGGFCASTATVNFNIPGPAPYIISPNSPLPTISCPDTTINGYSQPGASANTLGSGNNASIVVVLNGAFMTPPAAGLTLNADRIFVKGLAIKKFIGQPGILISKGADAKIEGNFIGTDATETGIEGNGVGVRMSGGTCATIGGLAASARNVISVNTGNGVELLVDSCATGTQVINNFIGTNIAGTSAQANGSNGVLVQVANARIENNFIRYNLADGVRITKGPASVKYNDILANAGKGVYVAATECSPQGVFIRFNDIGYQTIQGIDLGDINLGPARDSNSATLSSPSCYHANGGTITAPIRAQNFPVITGVTYGWNNAVPSTTVSANLDSASATSYDIDLFNNYPGGVDSSNRGVGAQFKSSVTTLPTDAMGFVSFQISASGVAVYHPTMTASTPFATTGGTSEFSVQAITPLVYTSTYTNYSITAGGSQSQTFTFLNADSVAVAVPMSTSNSPMFTVTSSTCGSVAAGGSCQVVVTYSRATTTTGEGAILTIGPISSASTPFAPVTVQPPVTYTFNLFGTAAAPLVTASPTSLTFASTAQGTQSLPQTVTINNADTAAITLGTPAIGPAEFFIAGTTCGTSQAPMSSCTITVKLSPFPMSTTGPTSGLLTIPTSAGSLSVGLSGTIAIYAATVVPSPVSFPNTTVLTNSPSQNVTFTNNSTGTISINAVDITGTNATDFQVVSTTCSGIVASTVNCTGVVRFTPQSLGAKTANVRFDSGGSSTLASLTGNSVPAAPVISSPATASGVNGSAFTYSITATNSPTSFGAAGLPVGLTVNTGTGVISGAPSVTGTFSATISATNVTGTGSQGLTITITAPTVSPTITSSAPANGTTGSAYSHSFTATGTTPITWSISSGAAPTGLTLNGSSGILSGTPTATGSFSFVVQAANGTLPNATQNVTITISAATVAPAITSTAPPNGTVGTAYSRTFTASGTTPITWSVASGTVPIGLTLSATSGVLSGTPTTAGSFSFVVQAANGTLPNATQNVTIVIAAATVAPVITSSTPANGTTGSAYSHSFTASGTTPITWSITSGVAPTGLTLNASSGILSGTATATGSFSFVVQAGNGSLPNATQNVTIVINAATAGPVITSSAPPSSITGSAYSHSFTASGTTPITWSITSGATPTGLTLNASSGVLSGTPTTVGSFSFVVQAANGTLPNATQNVTITIVAATVAPVITSSAPPNGTTTTAYSHSFTASGTTPITWSVTSGALPAGLVLNAASGALSGTPTTAGSFAFTVQAANGTLPNATQAYTIIIALRLVAPTISVAINPATIFVGGNAIGTVTISNTNTTPLTANAFTFPYAPGLVNAAVPNTSSTCAGANTTAVPGAGSYSQTTSFTIPASGSCSFTSAITSAIAGTYTGPIPAGLIVTSAGSSPASNSVTLTVTVAPTPGVTLSRSSINFGSRTINTTSPATLITLTNSGNGDLVISGITGSGNFGFTSTCVSTAPNPTPIAAGGSCPINITFTPLTVASVVGTITIASNAPGSPHTISLSGVGTAVPVPGFDVVPAALTFAARTINTTSPAQMFSIFNTGFANLILTSINVGSPFSRVPLDAAASPPDCGSSVAPGSDCQIAVVFRPLGTGAVTSQVLIVDNAEGSPHSVNLTGTGTPVPVSVIATSANVVFGDQIINSTSGSRSITISNTGTATLTTSAIALSGANAGNFSLTGQSGCASIPASGNCTLGLTFTPSAAGARAAQVNITSNAQNAATVNAVTLTGNGILAPRSIVSFTATTIGYGEVIFGGATPSQVVTITNTGGQALLFPNIAVVGDFVQSNDCGASLAPQAVCTINIQFTPLAQGPRFGELVLTTNAATSPDKIQLSGTGCRWFSQAQSKFFLTACGN